MLRDLMCWVRQHGNRWLVSTLAITAALIGTSAAGAKPVRQPTQQDLATVWVGGATADTVEFLRLELDLNGRGLLSIQYLPDQPAAAYQVKSSLEGYALHLDLVPLGGDVERIEVGGKASPSMLRLTVKARSSAWTRQVELQRYDELLRRIQAVTESAATHKQ